MTREQALADVAAELDRATAKYGPFHSAHEGYGVIMEEVNEFEDAIRGKDFANLREEATQCAAMFVRFLIDTR
jgi:NTP pyrophosphatase (non-canonical NTP hydrolase)